MSSVELVLLGVSHKTSKVEAREGFGFGVLEARAVLEQRGDALPEALILSTCNRVELYAFSSDPDRALARLHELMRDKKGSDPLEAPNLLTEARGEQAATHLMRVAAGLDSMVLGEGQILSQVKEAWELARSADSVRPRLDRLLSTATHAGKRARSETSIGAGAVSVASATVALATRVFGDLAERRVLVVGAGQTGRLAARHFSKKRPLELLVANRGLQRAEAVAREVGGRAVPLGELIEALAGVDVAVFATSSPSHLVTAEATARAMRHRGKRPLVLLDIAVPRDVDPAVAANENVFLHSVDALRSVVDRSLARRRGEVERVETIIREESDKLSEWLRGRDAAPVLRKLHEHFERVRVAELEKNLKQFPEAERERVDRVTRSIVHKLLQLPTSRLKDADHDSAAGLGRLEAARQLFALGPEDPEHDG